MSPAERFWLAYLWLCHAHWEQQCALFMRAIFAAYDTPAARRLHEITLRQSPLLSRYR